MLAVAACVVASRRPLPHGQSRLAVAIGLAGWWWGRRVSTSSTAARSPARSERAERARVDRHGAAARRPVRDARPGVDPASAGGRLVHEATCCSSCHSAGRLRRARSLELVRRESARRRAASTSGRWLRRRGVHVVLRSTDWRRRRPARRHRRARRPGARNAWRRSVAAGLHGERKALLEGVVLGDDSGLSRRAARRGSAPPGCTTCSRSRARTSRSWPAERFVLAWLVGLPRLVGRARCARGDRRRTCSRSGAQPSVVRAGIAGALGSLAWLTARARDRWYFLLVGAIVLLAWNPYTLFDAGFQLSFAAVVAIFVARAAPQARARGLPASASRSRDVVAISAACGLATAPILWLQFPRDSPLLAVPANALAAPAVVPLLGLALARPRSRRSALRGRRPRVAERLVRGLPRRVRPGRRRPAVRADPVDASAPRAPRGALLVAAYAWPRWRTS